MQTATVNVYVPPFWCANDSSSTNMLTVQNISQHFRVTCCLKGAIGTRLILSDLICICFSCHLGCPRKHELSLWRRNSNSAKCRHNLSSRGVRTVHTTHKSIIDESIQQMNPHHWPPDADNFRCEIVDDLSQEEVHRQNIYSVVRVNTAIEVEDNLH